MPASLSDWFFALPPVTRWTCSLAFALSTAASFSFISPYQIAYLPHLVFSLRHLQLWRLVSAVLYLGNFSLPFLFNLVFLLQYSRRLEEDFHGRTADYVFCLLFATAVMLLAASTVVTLPFLSSAYLLVLVYIWCRRNPNVMQRLMFINIPIESRYFPWALVGLHAIMGASPIPDLVGIAAGHLYTFLTHDLPRRTGRPPLLQTPAFLHTIFPPRRIATGGDGGDGGGGGVYYMMGRGRRDGNGAGDGDGNGDGVRRRWGQGHVLGRQ
eukprot:gb/GECH01013867.1/.p1 GENE.gb/GECH01013867.1/~~gb/GECH01013867.1/.p1  ORF type:complete len:268 (+),score=76.75 gb/GECH01013867.1/:1-804(+)